MNDPEITQQMIDSIAEDSEYSKYTITIPGRGLIKNIVTKITIQMCCAIYKAMRPLEPSPKIDNRTEIIEKLACIEHERWSSWQNWVHKICVLNSDGTLTIPKASVDRWQRQIETEYKDLSEQEKQSDRAQVLRYLHLIQPSAWKHFDQFVWEEHKMIICRRNCFGIYFQGGYCDPDYKEGLTLQDDSRLDLENAEKLQHNGWSWIPYQE